MNHTHESHGSRAVGRLAAVRETRAHLDAMYAAGDVDTRKVAAAHDSIRLGVKIAMVEATLEQTDATWALVQAVRDLNPTPSTRGVQL